MDVQVELLTLAQVGALTGWHRSTIYRRSRAGDFPAPVMLGPQSPRWKADELEAWIESRERRVPAGTTAEA